MMLEVADYRLLEEIPAARFRVSQVTLLRLYCAVSVFRDFSVQYIGWYVAVLLRWGMTCV